jgi:hypothetical protein
LYLDDPYLSVNTLNLFVDIGAKFDFVLVKVLILYQYVAPMYAKPSNELTLDCEDG